MCAEAVDAEEEEDVEKDDDVEGKEDVEVGTLLMLTLCGVE